MCGIAGIFGESIREEPVRRMVDAQRHRGPDADGVFVDSDGKAVLGHNRLSIIDLSDAGSQPMYSSDGRYVISFGGEIYNYRELRRELSEYAYRSQADTEVILAAFQRWGVDCLERFIGMFAFLLWDSKEKRLFAARDRFGVKPLYHCVHEGRLVIASELGAMFAGGVRREPDEVTWATYLAFGLTDHSERTFWEGIEALPPGHFLTWNEGEAKVQCWYDLKDRAEGPYDERPIEDVQNEYLDLLRESVALRFRSDVPVGINVSGGLDSSTLLALVKSAERDEAGVTAYTFATGDERYDELPWVRRMLEQTQHPWVVAELGPEDVPALADSVFTYQLEPFGGIPTLAYARLFEVARDKGTKVILDGQGMDEQWAGYDYYSNDDGVSPVVQGSRDSPVRPNSLAAEFRKLAAPLPVIGTRLDSLQRQQYRDIRHRKIPRALRFNDRVSMRSSRELREPFLDHRLVELALRQRPDRKIREGEQKWFLRRLANRFVPSQVAEAPKRPVQTPQREWLQGPLREWADESIKKVSRLPWFVGEEVLSEWRNFLLGRSDNSSYVWQWISVATISAIPDSP
jgi:asparagine synthase (glutamine-hydrolysing)